MIRNPVGFSDVEVTSIGLGTAQLGNLYDDLDAATSTAIVTAAWNAGVRYFDTAPHYGLGLAEQRLGIALAPHPRSKYVISSKVGRLIVDGARQWDFSASGVLRSIEESLARLGLDRIDIALIHDPQEHLHEALMYAYPALARLRDEGVVRAIGAGTGDLRSLAAFAKQTDIDALMIAGRFTLLEAPALTEVVPACAEAGISILNAGIFNTGLLATAHPSAGARYAAAPPALLARAQHLAALAERAGSTLPQAALKFAARDHTVASVVVGADSPEQIAATVRLGEDPRPLDALWHELESPPCTSTST
jgi:D-threo-aldose 1-dehydrogenase